MTDTHNAYQHPSPHPQRRWTRRAMMGAGGAFVLAGLSGCTIGSDDEKSTPEPTEVSVPEPTQGEPTPTQEPIGSPVAGYLDPARWKGRSISVATAAAGDYLQALQESYFDAFQTATGATVRHTEFGRDGLTTLVQQVDDNDVIWDVALIPTENVLPLAQKGYLLGIDYNVIDTTSLYPEIAMQHAVGQALYSTAIVYPWNADPAPSGWADFWNLDLFGGTRALRRLPVGTLEFALLADGITTDKLYPLDIPRAFAKLEEMRETAIFYEDSKQPVELVRTGQVGLASAWSVRTALPDVANAVKLQWIGGMISADSWAIPRGAPNADVAMSFINFATRAVPAANFSRLQPFGPVNKDAFALLRPDIVANLPTAPANIRGQFFQGWSYWAEHTDSLTAQFEDWLLNPNATPAAGASPAS
ncbi:MAG: extracellular solute-binding protein [Thermomicrobiales bacterium]